MVWKVDNMSEWIAVVDDDATNLKAAGVILSKAHMRVTALISGELLLNFISQGNRPDLILLDVMMTGMNGFDTIQSLREAEKRLGIPEIPVIFLTASDDSDTEARGLSLGAMDFIKKPFVPQVLVMRVKNTIELVRLQRDLAREVAIKTKENEELAIQVVLAIAGAIDAKDTYTNGHSDRVAAYSREIARRCGCDEKRQADIYMMGLLHDVGKIGVPDAVINKPARLNDDEFELIKKHPVIGSGILKNIKAMPTLSTGARWHHERFGGGGYPDGLTGSDIPWEARVIAVADAYDAMSSRRSYRDVMPQDRVRSEIVNGRGTQFDPELADVMLSMIDEDTEYSMREV